MNGDKQKKDAARDSVTADNWGFPPHNRKGFQSVQSLFPTARLVRGAGPVKAFDYQFRDLLDISYTGMEGDTRNIHQMLDETFADSFLVAKDDVILTDLYFNQMQPDSHHLMNSISKSFVGALTGIVAEQGLIDISKPVREYVPEFAGGAFNDTTIRTALDMSASAEFGEDYADESADFWVEASVVGWRPALVKSGAPDTLIDHALSLRATQQEEGEKFQYRTVLTTVLGMVLERATGRSLVELLQAELWAKIRPEQDACIVVDRIGFPYVGAGMNACARDLLRFGRMLAGGGLLDGVQIVPGEWLEDTRYGNSRARELFAVSDYEALFPGGHYRNQFWVSDAERGVIVCLGIYGQTIHVNMSTGTVIVKFSSHPEPADMPLFVDALLAMDAISEAV